MKRKQKPVSRFSSERERYVEAARLVYTKGLTLVEAIRETGVCVPDFLEVSKQASWPVKENWSGWFKCESEVTKLLYMAELV